MNCPSCGTPNPAQARFCMGCGQLLVNGVICSTCHTLLPSYARYCFNCGAMVITAAQMPTIAPNIPIAAPTLPPVQPVQPIQAVPEHSVVKDITLPEMLDSLRQFLPEDLYEPLERRPTGAHLNAVRNHLEALLRTTKTYLPWPVVTAPQPAGVPAGGMVQGTFLLSDMSGFTAMSERLSRFGQAGAEQITRIINELFYEQVSVLFQYGGTLLKFGGDALLGVFIAEPENMAESAWMATQAAWAMQKAMQKFARIDAGGETHTLKIKCGVSSGRYFAAHIGTQQNMAYVTTGHTVNRSDEAQSFAEPGDIIISQSTLDLLGDRVEVEKRDEGFYLLRNVDPMEGALSPLSLDEPLSGSTLQQIAYLVERMDRLAPYLPAELIARIVSNPDNAQITPDHRPVTVMFINYVGVSDLIEDMGDSDPDLITRHLNDYFVQMAEIVERYEGTVSRMDQYTIGDRVVVFFGAPRAHEDDPVRSIYTALDIQEVTHKHFAALQTPSGIYRFRQRIGINTGHLFAGNVGAPNLRQEYTLMGDNINMAARLMSKSGWDQIFITKKTRERVSAFFELKDEGELKVKGKEILIPTYQVLRRREQIGRVRGLESGDSPYTGRVEELQAIKMCGQGLLTSGQGQIVSVIADSGFGKSRLLQEFKNWFFTQEDADRVLWSEARCLSFSEQSTYWLAVQMLRGLLEIKQDANQNDILFALWERGEDLLGKETAREAVPFLAHIMGLHLEGEWAEMVNGLTPEVRQKQSFWAAREFVAAAAQQRPTVITLDDLHWADEASLALVQDLLENTVNAPLMFCLLYRPRRDKGCWRLRDKAVSEFPHRHTEIMLKPLSHDLGAQLLARLLPGAAFTADQQKDILNKSSGNPFYLEEIVRSLIESGAVEPDPSGQWHITEQIADVTVPDTLEGVIMARIDRLSETARQALQIASVIGRSFEMRILHHLTETKTELGEWLTQLERDDLIRPVSATERETYVFPNALVQEVAYDNLLVQRRQSYHRRVGEALEVMLAEHIENGTDSLDIDLDSDGIPERGSELLAYHFSRSDDRAKAMLYLERAGLKAQSDFANTTARGNFSSLLDLLGEEDSVWEKRFDILDRRQRIYKLSGDHEARRADLETMRTLAQTHNDECRQATVLLRLADLYDTTSRYDEAQAAAQEALDIRTRLCDQKGQAEALYQLGVLSYYRGDHDQALPLLEQAIELQEAVGDREGESWSVMYVGMIHFVRGKYSDASGCHEHALLLAQARQDGLQVGIHLTNSARVCLNLGKYEQAIQLFEQSLQMKIRVGDRMGQAFNHFGTGMAHLALEQYDEAERALHDSLMIRQQIHDERGMSYCMHGLGQLALKRGQFGPAKDYLQQAYQMHSRLGLKGETIEDLSALGQVYLGADKLDVAVTASTQAMNLLAQQVNVPGEEHQILFNHFKIMAVQQDATACDLLKQTYAMMHSQADLISNPADRQVYLEQHKLNQEIMAEVNSGKWELQ